MAKGKPAMSANKFELNQIEKGRDGSDYILVIVSEKKTWVPYILDSDDEDYPITKSIPKLIDVESSTKSSTKQSTTKSEKSIPKPIPQSIPEVVMKSDKLIKKPIKGSIIEVVMKSTQEFIDKPIVKANTKANTKSNTKSDTKSDTKSGTKSDMKCDVKPIVIKYISMSDGNYDFVKSENGDTKNSSDDEYILSQFKKLKIDKVAKTRTPSAYNIFIGEKIKFIKQHMPDIANIDRMKKAQEMWQAHKELLSV